MRVLNFGSLNIDYVYPVDHIIIPGDSTPVAVRADSLLFYLVFIYSE